MRLKPKKAHRTRLFVVLFFLSLRIIQEYGDIPNPGASIFVAHEVCPPIEIYVFSNLALSFLF